MPLPARIDRNSHRQEVNRRSPAHRAWVRGFACCACGAVDAIECAHVRDETGGGTGLKPSDRWCISLCSDCHQEQHSMGEASFSRKHGINMKALAAEFAAKSPHAPKLKDMP